MKPISAAGAADRHPPWLTRQRLRHATVVAGALLLLYAVLVVIAMFGGPRIGASFLPLPGGGPDPVNPVAGLEPSTRLPSAGPTVPRGSETPVPTTPPSPGQTTTLPPATTIAPATAQPTDGQSTPCPTTKPVPQVVDHEDPTIPPATKVPPAPTTTTKNPTTNPTKPPATTNPPPTTPTNPPTTPDDPEDPDVPTLGGIIGGVLDLVGL